MEKNDFFAYSWHFIEEDELSQTAIRIYGVDRQNNNVCVRINNFTPYAYIELPENVDWNETNAQLVCTKIDNMTGDRKPILKRLMYKKRLYYANLDKDYNRKLYPYIFCNFTNTKDIAYLRRRLYKPIMIAGIGCVKLKMHEYNASPILQLTSLRLLPPAGWISFKGQKSKEQITHCSSEYVVNWKNLSDAKDDSVGRPKLMGFDIEVNSSNPSAMPKAGNPEDKVFQISCVFALQGAKDIEESFLLTLGRVDESMLITEEKEQIQVRYFETEHDLLLGFKNLIQEKQPNIIIGYNIFNFDIPYMIKRSELLFCQTEFAQQGMNIGGVAQKCIIDWSSSAYKNQKFEFLDAEGRIFVDLLPLVKRDYKFANYRLKTIAEFFLKNKSKDPLDPKGIFKCYRLGMQGGPRGERALAVVGKYCVKDSELVVRLFEVMKTWVGLCEMSKVTNVPVFQLYTQGQQLKIFSSTYKKCTHENTIVEKDAYTTKADDHYVGATVFPPVPGFYRNVTSFDFCLTGDTLVSLANGTSKRLDRLYDEIEVLGCNEGKYSTYKTVNGLQVKGVKKTVKVLLQDGEYLTCTPDHKIYLENGEVCEAKDLEGKYIRRGPKFTEDIVGNDEKDWTLKVGKYTLDMQDNREMSLAFARILGYMLSDGSIYETKGRKAAEVAFGTLYDLQDFTRDLSFFCKVPSHRKKVGDKGTILMMNIPKDLAEALHDLEDIVVGKRATQAMKLPSCLENCPLSFLREFLAGLFGGDGCAPHISKKRICSVSLRWTTVEDYMDEMQEVMNTIETYLARFDIRSMHPLPLKVKYGRNGMVPQDGKSRYDFVIRVPIEDLPIYKEKIGMRYCINKQTKMEVISSYVSFCQKVQKQREDIFELTTKIRSEKKFNIEKSVQEAIKEYEKDNFLLFSDKPSSGSYSYYIKNKNVEKKWVSSRYVRNTGYQPQDYVEELGVQNWFNGGYAVGTDDTSFPCYHQKVLKVLENGELPVYDIEVSKVHNYIANGVNLVNCSLYPSAIMAYNLCWSTLVLDEKIPDEKCYTMQWEDHIGCVHDPRMIRVKELEEIIKEKETEIKSIREERDKKENKHRKEEFKLLLEEKKKLCKPYRDEKSEIKKSKPKHIVCAKRKYRWLKTPMGVLPEILTHLISSRKVAKKQLEAYEKQRDSMEKGTEEYEKISTLIEVMDKRQLALKVSANSMYGATGVRNGYLPFMPVAMCTTYKGRLAVQLAAECILKEHKGELVYGDSVTGDTPIMIKHESGKIEIKRIDELSDTWKPYPGFKAWDKTLQNKEQSSSSFSVWTGDEWSKIKRVIRHKTYKNMFRVSTSTGSVDVTEDHSLMTENRKKIKPCSLRENTRLWHSFPYRGGSIVENKIICCSSKVEAQSIFLQCRIQGMKPSIITKDDKFYIDLSGKNINRKVYVFPLGKVHDYVYDLETEKGVFHAGIGELIVKNTDSNYVTFPHLTLPKELWDYSIMVAKEVTSKFPKPMELAFEKNIMSKFFIITKKRYMYLSYEKDGSVSKKISKKGVLLQRRDNCNLIRKIYGDVIMGIFNESSCEDILYNLVQDINNMCAHVYPTSEFIVTKSVGDPGNYSPKQTEEEKDGKPKLVYKIGDYTIQPRDILTENNRASLFKKKDHYGVCTCYVPNHTELHGQEVCDVCKEFYLLCLPAQAQLAEKMRQRGQLVAPGTRLEYVITSNGGTQAKQSIKIEPDDYFVRHAESLELDYLYYLKQMSNPIDQVLNIMFLNKPGIKYKKDFVLEQYKYRLKVRDKVIQSLKNLFKSRLEIVK